MKLPDCKRCAFILLLCVLASSADARDANLTKYPIVFAHGLAGFDDILGFDYWGDDYGVFVLDPCDKFLEFTCNPDIHDRQKSFVASVQPLLVLVLTPLMRWNSTRR